jgi:hypothetical protein
MSGNKLAGGDKTTTISVRVDEATKDEYQERVDSMSGDLADYINERVGSQDYDTPLQPPYNPRLARGYKRLVDAATENGHIRGDTARRVVSGGPNNISKDEAIDLVLKPLHRNGYIKPTGTILSQRQYWELNGWNRGERR